MSELYNNNYAAGQDSNFMDWNDTIQSDGAEFVVLETGDYEFEGHTFDTMVPITVDMDAIADATKTMMDEIMADPAAMGMIQGFVQNSMQQSGQTFDAEAFPEQMKAGFDEFIAHFPKTVTSEFYTNSDGSEAF